MIGYIEVNVRKDGAVEHPMYLMMDRSSWIAMDACNGINDLFVEMGSCFETYLRHQNEEHIDLIKQRF